MKHIFSIDNPFGSRKACSSKMALFAQMTELKNDLTKLQLKYYNIFQNINDKNTFETTLFEHCWNNYCQN